MKKRYTIEAYSLITLTDAGWRSRPEGWRIVTPRGVEMATTLSKYNAKKIARALNALEGR